MTRMHLEFACSICSHVISGDYEEDDFEYPVFCPKCGRQNALPRLASTAQIATPCPPAVAPVAAAPIKPVVTAKATVTPKTAAPAQSRPAVVPPKPAGRIAWRFPAERKSSVVGLRNCPAIDVQGRIIAALGRDLVALVPKPDGCDLAWKFTAADVIPGSPVIADNGIVFAHSSDGLLHAIDADGKPVRPPTKVGAALGWATPLVDAERRILISAAAGGLIRVDAEGTTTSRPYLRSPSRFDCTGAMAGSTLFIGSEDQFVHAIDLSGDRGKQKWNQREKVGLTGWYVNSAIAIAPGPMVIAVSRDDHAYAFCEDGSIAWKVALDGRAIGSPVVNAEGQVVVGLSVRGDGETQRGRLVALDANGNGITWSCDVEHPVESTPVIGESGEIYFGDNGGNVHAIDAHGRKLWSEAVGAAARSPGTLLATGHVVFGLDDGSLAALRCDSRALAAGWPKLLCKVTNRP